MDNNILNKRTKVKWTITQQRGSDRLIIYEKENLTTGKIAVVNHHHDYDKDIAEANAAIIVKAVNNYDSLLAENEKLKRLLEDLTPGGSEFVNDPQYCFDFVKKEINSIPSQILPFKKRSEKLLSVLKRISDAHDCYAPNYGMTDGIFKEVEEAIIGGTLPPIN